MSALSAMQLRNRCSRSAFPDVSDMCSPAALRFLERAGVIETPFTGGDADDPNATSLTVLPDDFAERQPALAQLAAASVSGLLPAGPERRDRPPIPFGLGSAIEITAPLAAAESGFSLHAATTAAAEDSAGREALCRYVLRPPLSNERIELASGDLVRIRFRHPYRDGTTAIELDPLSLLVRLAASVPAPKFNTVRYGGVLAANSKWRSQIVPPPADSDAETETAKDGADDATTTKRPTHRSGWRPWQELLKRSFKIEVEKCEKCGARLKLRKLVTRRKDIVRILKKLGLPTDPPSRAPARDPPFFKSRVVRRQLGAEPVGQGELFS
jgi:hypothetical protein